MTKRKKIIVLSCMIALLAVTAVFNFVLTSPIDLNSGETNVIATSNYFTQYRNERLNSRNEELLQLDSVIQNAEVSSEEYANALSLKIELTEMTEKEFLLENLIKAYGFEDVVVVIGLDSNNVNVIAKTEELSTDDAIAIYTIIQEEHVVSAENVKIIPIS